MIAEHPTNVSVVTFDPRSEWEESVSLPDRSGVSTALANGEARNGKEELADAPDRAERARSNGQDSLPLARIALCDLERMAITQTLESFNGNRTKSARTLGISVRTLQRKLRAWETERPSVGGDVATADRRMRASTAEKAS